ncbi:MAG: adenylosuccinate synthetase [Chloroflexales bacterium]|nr:adenylosuccinate synthetase [Chloroflexales bacterium]
MPHAYLTVDLGFGDAGKGTVVDYLARAREAHTVVRYNGGAQAAHRVVCVDSREHVFAQFGSGALAGAATHLSRFMLLDPLAMIEEERHLQSLGVRDSWDRTTIDRRALVFTPVQRAAKRLQELARGDGRHGSCGMGVGETMVDFLAHGDQSLFAGDLPDADELCAKLRFLRAANLAKVRHLPPVALASREASAEFNALLDDALLDQLVDDYRAFANQARIVDGTHLHAILAQPGAVIFEGAQGALLDEWQGFHPYTTRSTTTLANAERLLAEAGYTGDVQRVGITRAYATRHGAGPLPSEDAALTQCLPDARNTHGAWQGGFRVGWLDLVLLRYALDVVGPLDWLAVTCLDRVAALGQIQVCSAYRYDAFLVDRIARCATPHDLAYQEQITRCLERCAPVLEAVSDQQALLARIDAALGVPVGLVSEGPTAADKRLVFA